MILDLSVLRWILTLIPLVFATPFLHAASFPQAIQLTVYWEGRQLLDPNLEALERLRLTYPQVPLLHLINPSYFLGSEPTGENLQAMLRAIRPEDEVGLYLSSIDSLLQTAKVPIRFRPTFWGNADEKKYCQNDCGLDVPLAGRSREEMLQIFVAADRALRKMGFERMQSYGVRGWIFTPFLPLIASSFGYRFDHTPLVPELVSTRLRRYPLLGWVRDLWSLAEAAKPTEAGVQLLPINGSVIELSEPSDVKRRFAELFAAREKNPDLASPSFQIAFSQESAYYAVPRLSNLLKELSESSLERKAELVFITPSQAKNGRPNQENVRISKEF